MLGGVHRTVCRMTELHDAKSINLATLFQRTVIEVGHHQRHRVTFIECSRTVAAERTFHCTVCIDEVGIIVGRDVHHAQGPLRGIPLGIVQMVPQYAVLGGRPGRMGFLIDIFIFTKVDAVEQSWVVAFPPRAFAVL